MSWRDRPYAGEPEQPEMRLSMPRPTTAVTWLIAANVVLYFVKVLTQHVSPMFWSETFGLSLSGLSRGYVWQPLTYMFSHSGVIHLLGNMVGLYLFGIHFERTFGRNRFLSFYAICGLIGGLAYLILSAFSPAHRFIPLVGASGAVYGLLMAAIIFFPHVQLVLIIFPVSVRVFGLIVAGVLLLTLIGPEPVDNLGGELCHVGGAAAGVATLYFWRLMPRIRVDMGVRIKKGAWERKIRREADEQAEVDRILAKVSEQGLGSLSRGERKALERATKRQRTEEREIERIGR